MFRHLHLHHNLTRTPFSPTAAHHQQIRTMASDSIRNSHIEVERKFVPTALLQAQLDGKFREYERLRQQQGPDKVAQPSSMSKSPGGDVGESTDVH